MEKDRSFQINIFSVRIWNAIYRKSIPRAFNLLRRRIIIPNPNQIRLYFLLIFIYNCPQNLNSRFELIPYLQSKNIRRIFELVRNSPSLRNLSINQRLLMSGKHEFFLASFRVLSIFRSNISDSVQLLIFLIQFNYE